MRLFLLLFALVLSENSGFAAPYFQVRFSRPLAVYLFVNELSGNGRPGNPFQKLYTASLFETPETKAALADFDTLNLYYSYEFPQYPALSKIPGQTDALLRRALLLSTDLSDFKNRATGILPKEDFARFLRTLAAFEVAYDSLVYFPLKQDFTQQLSACTQRLHAPTVSDFFRKMARFHGQQDTGNDTFQVAFYPLPKSRGFRATAFADCSVSALPEGERDYEMLLSVTLHEIAHILYDDQPLFLKETIQRAFQESKFPGAANAYLLLNEAQATALGNGAAYLALTGTLDSGSWYNNKYRNDMAKAMYPLVADYLNQSKTIDSAFVAEYCRLYATRFPEWEGEAAHLFTNRFVVANDYAAIQHVQKAFPVTSNTHGATPFNAENLEKLRASALTKILILDPAISGNVALARRFFPEIQTDTKTLQKGFARYKMPDGTWLYVLFTGKKPLAEILQKL